MFVITITDITCDIPTNHDTLQPYPASVFTLSAAQLVTGQCPENSQQQTRFLNGATTEIVKCIAYGATGLFSQQPTGCIGSNILSDHVAF